MIRYRMDARTIGNRIRKRYVVAVLVGLLLGGAYAVAAPPSGTEAQASPPKPPLAHQSRAPKSPSLRDDCTSGPAGVVFAPPTVVSAYPIKWSPAHSGKTVCGWAI